MNKTTETKLRNYRHFDRMKTLLLKCGVGVDQNIEYLTAETLTTLAKYERTTRRLAMALCNFGDDDGRIDKKFEKIEMKVMAIFDGKLEGFFINRDPRGYALKIDDEIMKTKYADVPLEKDWGGYGILSPEE